MEKLFYDFHIHSCLSPCGDDEAAPADIAMLAKLVGLDAAALTDHNTCKNCPAFWEVAEASGLIPIAGMELTVAEEFHVLCLFPKLESAMSFDEHIHGCLLPIENDERIYGRQLIMNSDGEVTGKEPYCLINATTVDFYSLAPLIESYGGIIIPAHIDRSAMSLIATLGGVPPDAGFTCAEIRYPEAVGNLKEKYPYLRQCRVIHDSDAHTLENISLPANFIETEARTPEAIIEALKKHD